MAHQAQVEVAEPDNSAAYFSDESLSIPLDTEDLEVGLDRSINCQFDRYMAQAKKTSLMSRDELVEASRLAYAQRYEVIKVLSRFPACICDLVERFDYQRSKKLKLSSIVSGIGEQTPRVREQQYQYNVIHGPDTAADAIADETKFLSALESLKASYEEFQADCDADRALSIAQELMTMYRMLVLRVPVLESHMQRFIADSSTVIEFVTVTGELLDVDTAAFIGANLEAATIQSVAKMLDRSQRQTWQTLAINARNICDQNQLMVEQIVSMRRQFDAHNAQYREHINQIVQANLLLAARLTLRHGAADHILFDACQEANEGLIVAAERFNYWKGYAFATYAPMWIKRNLSDYYDNHSRIWSVPFSVTLRAHKVREARKEIANERDKIEQQVTATEIAHRLELDVGVVNNTLLAYKDAVTDPLVLEYYLGANEDSCEKYAATEDVKRVVRTALDTLPPRKRDVCMMRMGIGIPRVMTLTEVANKLNISSEAVRLAQQDALRILREGRYARHLADLFQHA